MNEASRKTSFGEALRERVARDGVAALTKPERTLVVIEEFAGLVLTSDFVEELLEMIQLKGDEVLESLTAIGALETRAIVEAPVLAVRESPRVPESTMQSYLSSAAGRQFSCMINQLQVFPDNLDNLVRSYAELNQESFLGPKTQLELWRSRRDRGVFAAKRRVTVKLSLEAEAKRDAAASTRKCPECDYPSPDYRKTCKACGFPHGAED